MPNFISEDQIEQALLQKLQHVHGYDVLDCGTEEREDLAEFPSTAAATTFSASGLVSARYVDNHHNVTQHYRSIRTAARTA